MSLVFLESSVDNSIHDESKIYLFPQKKKLHDPFVAHEFCSNTLPASSTNREWKTIDRWPSLVQLYSSTIFCAWDALCFCNVRRRHVTLRSPVPSNRVNKNKKLGKKIFFPNQCTALLLLLWFIQRLEIPQTLLPPFDHPPSIAVAAREAPFFPGPGAVPIRAHGGVPDHASFRARIEKLASQAAYYAR
jgi:hypothetical protein